MTGTAEAPLYIDMNGVRNSNDDPDDPNVRPINVSIRWNGFDDKYLAITGLDNSECGGKCHFALYLERLCRMERTIECLLW